MNLFIDTVKRLCFNEFNSAVKAQYGKEINEQNYKLLKAICKSSIVVMSVLFLLSHFNVMFSNNKYLYLGMDIISAILLIISVKWFGPHKKSSLPLLYTLIFFAYLFGIIIGTVLYRDNSATTICVMMMISPVLILDVPYRVLIFNGVECFLFAIAAFEYKVYDRAIADVSNLLIFYICNIPVAYYSNKTRLENIFNRDKLLRQSELDFLTGAYNRMAIDRYMKSCIGKSPNASMFMIDVDNFKMINDTFGHNKGDDVLCEIAHMIQSCTNHAGMTARYGGDEFVVFLPNVTDRESVEDIAKNIMNHMDITIRKKEQLMQVTISMGVTINTSSDFSCDEICQQADRAMYQIKQLNKNGYAFYG